MKYSINISDDYVVPAGQLTAEQYVEYVMNMAAKSYMNQYKVVTPDEGIQAACEVYNASLPPAAAETVLEVTE